ncbi:hypothetical protein IW140_004026 [Coemansia sp. RSA 1813]|nr:hypothetical protein EV178_003961 [Coemansia sp. RSA 1646]KAJ1771139.1 hypothetical protein LPJ74_002632 [Coemansia sp. RSA 1843]KAJ2088471.1 hypothetical protein IW138_004159 [Coemansia sp. RSA 986]KAJ2217064.1 hypothetical protein EV179_000831 [Coemansia sp. RSA 487]KAJ2568298.1 hypothetical protein IW140_004026 [Coemansia sp. RSA 1813]
MSLSATTANTTNTQPTAEATGNESWYEALAAKVIGGMHQRTVSIGRGHRCMVQIGRKATTISRIHAEIKDAESGRYSMRILGTNGVRVNGVLCTKGSTIDLQTGDEINFVGIKYKFRAPQEQQPAPEPCTVSTGASSDLGADDWWPEPVRKRIADSENISEQPAYKRVREMSSEYRGSTDTLVNSSDAACALVSDSGQVDVGKSVLLAKQLIDDLPPSSPIYMSELADMAFAEPDDHFEDTLPDSIDILGTTPVPEPTKALPVATKMHKPRPAVLKENVDPAQLSKQSKPDKVRKPQRCESSGTNNDQNAKQGKIRRGATKADEEMMESLRELLGIVDPSECLADSIDSETEEFLTTPPALPVSIPSESSLIDLVIETMVFSARTSHTISDLVRDIARIEDEAAMRTWRHHLTRALFHNRCFGRVERRVKDASDKRAEDKWYYDAAKDECAERRENFGGLVRTARRCTLRDTQYFFKQVPKLPSFRYR